MNELLKLIKRLMKQGHASAEEKQRVKTMLKALDDEEQEVIAEDAGQVDALPEEAPAGEDDELAEVEKGIKALIKSSMANATSEMKEEMKAYLAEQKEAMEKKAGIYHPDVVDKRKNLNSYIRKFANAVLENDTATLKELSTDAQGSPFGGYVVDSELSAEIRHLVTEYGVARREMAAIQLSKNSYRANELVTDVSVAWVDEGAVIPSKEIVLDQESLSLKKLGAIVAITRELLEDQEVDLFAFIGNRVAEKFALAEDLMAFVGDGTSTYGGFTGIFNHANVNEVSLPDRSSSQGGDGTSFSHLSADDLFDMIAASPQSVRRTGKFYMSFSVMGIVRKLKDKDGDYIYQRPSETGPALIWGRPVVEVEVLPTTGDDAPDTAFVGYGDLKKSSIFGYRGGIAMDRFNAGVVRNVAGNADINLITTDREAVRWIERVGVMHIIPSAFTVLKTADES